MSVTLADLLAEPALHMVALATHCGADDRAISWVATTELTDPAPSWCHSSSARSCRAVVQTSSPPRCVSSWTDAACQTSCTRSPGGAGDTDELPEPGSEVPILVDRKPLAYLRSRGSQPRPDILSSAANVLGLEIARRHAVLRGQRLLAAQVLEDIVQRTGSESESRRRLSDLGLQPDGTHRVLIGRARRAADALTRHPTAILRLFNDVEQRHVSAWSADGVLLVLPAEADAGVVQVQTVFLGAAVSALLAALVPVALGLRRGGRSASPRDRAAIVTGSL